jgi:hypothetical protein
MRPCGGVPEADAGASAALLFPKGAIDAEDIPDGLLCGEPGE